MFHESTIVEPAARVDLPPLGADVEYAHARTGADTRITYEKLVLSWLQTSKPGSFSSRDGGAIYREADQRFTAECAEDVAHTPNTRDDFEVALSRVGYRAGVLVFQGASLWLLLLPASKTAPAVVKAERKALDQAFRELIDGEEALSAADVDSLLEVLADHS